MTNYVLMVVDASGSMGSIADDVRGGFNNYINDLAEDTEIDYRVTVGFFDTGTWLHARNKLPTEVAPLNKINYSPRGCTALYDCLGQLVHEIKPKVTDQDRVLVVVSTDGQENSSVEYKLSDIKQMITKLEEIEINGTQQWSFIYLASGPNAWVQAEQMGYQRASTVVVDPDQLATRANYMAMSRGSRRWSRGESGTTVASEIQENQDNPMEKITDKTDNN